MHILHLHEKTAIHGGSEVYISQLQELLPLYNYQTHWVGIEESEGQFHITEFGENTLTKTEDIRIVFQYIEHYIKEKNINLINIHNIFNPHIIKFCLNSLPVVKTAHGPVMVCPGKDKFWRYSEIPCPMPYGLHCFKHIYTEGCANRHPKRVLRAWGYVNFEIKEAASRYKKIMVMSEYIKQGLLEAGVKEEQIFCNPYFTNKIDVPCRGETDPKKILFIGRLVSSKGPHVMIKALSSLIQQRKDVLLQIIGDGNLKPQLISLVKSLGISKKVEFLGWLSKNDIDAKIGECYLVVFPSIYPEAFGIVGIEAMMQGKPVVAFDVGGVSTWMKDSETGFLVKAKDENLLREKTLKLLADSDLYNRMSLTARKVALERYTPSVHIQKLINLYAR